MSETGDKVVGDEERVRAAVQCRGSFWMEDRYVVSSVGYNPQVIYGVADNEDEAWNVAVKHPVVVAFEAQHRPASPKAVRDYTCGACRAEFTACREPRHPMCPYCGGDGIEEEDRVSQPLAVEPQDFEKVERFDPGKYGKHLYVRARDYELLLEAYRASIKPEAPEGAKVTWRVDLLCGVEGDEGYAKIVVRPTREDAESYMRYDSQTARLVKLTTTEEVVAVREAGK